MLAYSYYICVLNNRNNKHTVLHSANLLYDGILYNICVLITATTAGSANTNPCMVVLNGGLDKVRGGYYPRLFYPGLHAAKDKFLKVIVTVGITVV
jgi:hypothetical protein